MRNSIFLGICLIAGWVCAENPPSRVLQLDAVGGSRQSPVITALAYNATIQTLAAAGDDHAIRLIRFPDGTLDRVLAGHEDWVRTLDISRDGNLLVSAGNDARVLVWRRDEDWKPHRREADAQAVTCARFDPLGRLIAAAGFRAEIRLLGASDGKASLNCGCTDMRAIAFSPDGQRIVCGGRTGHIHVIGVTGLAVGQDLPVHRARIRRMEFLPESQTLVSCAEDGTVVATDLLVGKSISSTTVAGCKLHCLVPLTAQLVAVGGSDNLIHIVDVVQGKVIASWEGHRGSVAALVRCGNELASASYDTTLRLWDLSRLLPASEKVALEAPEARTSEASGVPDTTPR